MASGPVVLPALNSTPKCVKCGGTQASMSYTPADPNNLTIKTDYILRSCNRCGYSWQEAPLS